MSNSIKRGGAGVLVLVLILAVSGCGFRPLYKKGDQTTVADFQTIWIDTISGRSGQILHNFLRDRINPYGQPTAPRYRLAVSLSETNTGLSPRPDGTQARSSQSMTAQFRLVDLSSGAVVLTGRAGASNAYDSLTNEYSVMVSRDTARIRALSWVADDVRLKLGVFFAR